MLAAYVFSLIVSGGLLGVSLFSDFLDVDAPDVDTDVDLDLDGGVDGDFGATRIFSIRGLIYFLLGFGLTGTLVTVLRGPGSPWVTGIIASLSGAGAGALATTIFAYLKQSETGQLLGEASLEGRMGRMTLPFSSAGIGRVLIAVDDRTHELVARPFNGEAANPDQWREVVVVAIRDGKALVAPVDQALLPENVDGED